MYTIQFAEKNKKNSKVIHEARTAKLEAALMLFATLRMSGEYLFVKFKEEKNAIHQCGNSENV